MHFCQLLQTQVKLTNLPEKSDQLRPVETDTNGTLMEHQQLKEIYS